MKVALMSLLLLASGSLVSCASQEERAARVHGEAAAAYSAGDYVKARELALRAIGIRDDAVQYWLFLGRCEAALKNYRGAFAAYRQAAELDRASVEAIQALAQLSLMTGALDLAAEYADQLQILVPGNEAAQLTHGVIALRRSDYPEAERRAAQILARQPQHETAQILKARVLVARGEPAEAAALIERSIKVSGETLGKLEELRDIHREAGDAAALASTHRRLIALEPGDQDLKLDYLRDLVAREEMDEAVRVAGLLAKVRPFRAAQIGKSMQILAAAPAGAITRDHLALLRSEGGPSLHVALASLALERGFDAEAEALTRPFSDAPAGPANNAGIALHAAAELRLGRDESAYRGVERILKKDPRNPRALQVSALLALKRGDYDRAVHDAQLLVRDQPTIDSHRLLLAQAYRLAGNHQLEGLTLRRGQHELPASGKLGAAFEQYKARAASGALPPKSSASSQDPGRLSS